MRRRAHRLARSTRVAKAPSISLSVRAFRTRSVHPLRARRFLHMSDDALGTPGHPGSRSRAITLACAQPAPAALWAQLARIMLTPVRLPPGRARLATRPIATGSPTVKTIGIVEVAFFAASVARVAALGHDHVDLAARRGRRPTRAADLMCPRPGGIRSPRFGPRHSRSRSVPGGKRPAPLQSARSWRLKRRRGSRSPASPSARAPAVSGQATAAPPSRTRRRGGSFDDLVGAGEHRSRHSEAERLGGLQIDHQLERADCTTGKSAGSAPFRMRPT